MTKKILSLVLALFLTVGAYTVLPSKVNPLPTNDVCAANLAGAYKCKKYGKVKVMVLQWTGSTWKAYETNFYFEPSNVGQVYVLDGCGNITRPGLYINMDSAIKKGYLEKYY